MTSNSEKMMANQLEEVQAEIRKVEIIEETWKKVATEQYLVNKAILIAYNLGKEIKRKHYRNPWQEFVQGKLKILVTKSDSDWDTIDKKFHRGYYVLVTVGDDIALEANTLEADTLKKTLTVHMLGNWWVKINQLSEVADDEKRAKEIEGAQLELAKTIARVQPDKEFNI